MLEKQKNNGQIEQFSTKLEVVTKRIVTNAGVCRQARQGTRDFTVGTRDFGDKGF